MVKRKGIFLESIIVLLSAISCSGPSLSSTNPASSPLSESETTSVSSSSSIPEEAWQYSGERIKDERGLDTHAFTQANICAKDALNRTYLPGAKANERTVGMFYFLWHGSHETGIYDITQLLANDPDSLWNLKGTPTSPAETFHYWGQPLYGYYHSRDPWIITRHLEELTSVGIDYLIFDVTNGFIYEDVVNTLIPIYRASQNQGWKVPKLAFYVNSSAENTMASLFQKFYESGVNDDVWYKVNGKPFIVCAYDELTSESYTKYNDFFTMRRSQWPTARIDRTHGFPWIDWNYPQRNYSGTMSVSAAQQPGCAMSQQAISNFGRGYDFSQMKNCPDKVDEGLNIEQEWKSVFDSLATTKPIHDTFVTGWNEWMAIKNCVGQKVPLFVDTFNEEYSRDIEFMKGGYNDNYYLQLARHVREFRYETSPHYAYDEHTLSLNANATEWANVKTVYQDFVGDALNRHYLDCAKENYYDDNSARNDIASIAVSHDHDNLYFKIDCANAISAHEKGDLSWMNLFINSGEKSNLRFANAYDFVINRSPEDDGTTSIEKKTATGYESVGKASYFLLGESLRLSLPLSALGLSEKACHFQFKVSDHITSADDIMDYYVSGDSAPIGRLSYDYGY